MLNIHVKNAARVAAAAGLGLSLALAAAPVVAMADDGAAATDNVSGTATGQDSESQGVIQFDGKTYATLTEAFTAAKSGGTIKLLDNVTVSDEKGADARGLTGDVTLDLNGYTVYGANNNIAIRAISFDGGSLTIINGSIEAQQGTYCTVSASSAELVLKDVKLSNVTAYGMSVKAFDGGHIQLDSCTSTSTTGGAFAAAGGTIDVLSGTYSQTGAYDHNSSIFGSSDGTGVINVYGGTFTSENYGIYVFSSGGTVNFYGGDLTVTGDKPAVKGDIDKGSYPSATGLINIAGGSITGNISNIAKQIDVNISGGTFSVQPETNYLAEGAAYDAATRKVAINASEDRSIEVINPTGQIYGAYETLEAAIADAPAGATVKLLKGVAPTSTISIDKAITLTAEDGVKVTALNNGNCTFVLSNGATLDGLNITVDDVNAATNIVNMTDGATVKNCTFTGSYDLSTNDAQVCRAIEGSSGELTIEGNTFINLRQPGYINACTGSIAGNSIQGTRGWVVCGDSNMTISGNTFKDNAVDIAVIAANEGSSTNNYAGKATELSKSNTGAYVQDQLANVEAEDSVIVVGKSGSDATRYTLENALSAAQPGDTVKLLDNVECGAITVPAGVTLDGGNKTLTLNTKLEKGAFVTAGGNDVVIKDVTIDTNDNAKHGVQFYKVEGGSLDGVTVNGGNFTSVIVNGSEATIKDCTLNPGENAYANIEFGMGMNVTTVPEVTLEGTVKLGDAGTDIWVDADTVARIKDTMSGNPSDAQVMDRIKESVINNSTSDAKLSVKLNSTSDPSTEVVEGEKPVTPSEGEHAVKVERAEGGKVAVTPTTADKGDEVTITATPDKGQEVRSVSVTTKDGKSVKVVKGTKANTWTFEMPDAEVTVKVTFGCDGGELCPTHKFDDVDADAWYHDVVDWAVEEGLLSGYADGTLGPDGTLSRAQLATVLWRQAGEPEAKGDASFADCDPEAFYAEAVAWADEAGIIAGYGDGTNFGPEDPVTREQLATILWRQAGEPEGKGDLGKYPDGGDATDYAVPALEWAVDEGVLSGFGDGSLAPGGVLSRAMLAAMLQRMAE